MNSRLTLFRISVFGCAFAIWLTACDRDTANDECKSLQSAMASNDADQARIAFTLFINRLPSNSYSLENLKLLTSIIASSCPCSIIPCYECIDTNPETTELRIKFSSNSSTTVKTFDISSDASNNIVFRKMHD